MDQPSQDAWNRWAETLVKRELSAHDGVLKHAIGGALSMLRQQLREEQKAAVTKLEEEVAQLRAECTALRAIANGEVKPIGKRDAA